MFHPSSMVWMLAAFAASFVSAGDVSEVPTHGRERLKSCSIRSTQNTLFRDKGGRETISIMSNTFKAGLGRVSKGGRGHNNIDCRTNTVPN